MAQELSENKLMRLEYFILKHKKKGDEIMYCMNYEAQMEDNGFVRNAIPEIQVPCVRCAERRKMIKIGKLV